MFRPQTSVNRAIAAGIKGVASAPVGLTPKEIEAAYKLPIDRNSHQTVAVSIAFDTPKLAQYLAHYRSFFGLPPCTVASGCFRQVNEHGQAAPLPPSSVGSGWDLEAMLDVSMISVACPHCKILVVEAINPSFNKDYGGWVTVAGTSVSAPLIAGVYGLAGNASTIPLSFAYSRSRDLFDVTHGSNSLFFSSKLACGNDYLCVAQKGYDAPTGLGPPNGIGAF